MQIGNVKIKNNLFLAPMAGITDVSFRKLCLECGAGLTYTEMVSVKGLHYKSKNTVKLLETSALEHPCAVQLFGHEPEIFESVLKSGVLDKFDIIDLNMGCPAPKIFKNGDGSAILRDFELAKTIIKTCVSSTNKPVTVKFRKGIELNDDFLVEFAKLCEECGASAITVHPRTRNQMFSGKVDFNDIKKVKETVSIPVIASGDIVDRCTYEQVLKISGCDGVMIGRKALNNPQIFKEILDDKNYPVTWQIVNRHLEILKEYYTENTIVKIFKKHALYYLGNFRNSQETKRKIVTLNNLKEMEEELKKFFELN